MLKVSSITWLFAERLRINRKFTKKEMAEEVKREYNLIVTEEQCAKAKSKLLRQKKKQAMKCISHVYGIMNNLKLNNFFFLLLCSGSDHLFCYVTTKTISFVMLWLKPSLMLFNDSKLSSPLSSHFVNSTYHDHVFLVTPLCYVSLPSPLLTQTVPAISFIILFNTLTTHLLNHHEQHMFFNIKATQFLGIRDLQREEEKHEFMFLIKRIISLFN